MTDIPLLTELAVEISWFPYSSRVTPIELARNPARDQRIYLLLVVSDEEALAYNFMNKRIGVLANDEISDFNDTFEGCKIETSLMTAPDDPEIKGVGHIFDCSRRSV